jgi:hypothetical protein
VYGLGWGRGCHLWHSVLQWRVLTSDDVFQHVKGCKEKGKTLWWQCVRVVLVFLKGNSEVIYQLQYKCCDTILSPSNPSNACKTHLKSRNCSGYREGVKNGLIPVEEQPAAAEAACQRAASKSGTNLLLFKLRIHQHAIEDLKLKSCHTVGQKQV